MGRYLLKRLFLAVITLVILSVIIFFAGQVLPGNPARAILGPFAAQSAVNALNHTLGVDRPLVAQYWTWFTGLLHGHMGTSYQFHAPVSSFLYPALGHSLKLALLAFIIVVPLSILGGVDSGPQPGPDRGPDHQRDRALALDDARVRVRHRVIVIFAIGLKVLPYPANAPSGASIVDTGPLPAPAGHPARFRPLRLHRPHGAGRHHRGPRLGLRPHGDAEGTAAGTVIRRHVLRNSLLPTITVIATQTGYLIGGLVVVETLFNYPGLGRLIYTAAQARTSPCWRPASSSSGSSTSPPHCSPTSSTQCSTHVSD